MVSRAARRAKSHPPKKISAARTKSPAKFASPWRKPLHIPCQSIKALTLSKTVTFTFAATKYSTDSGKNSERTMKFCFRAKVLSQMEKVCYNRVHPAAGAPGPGALLGMGA